MTAVISKMIVLALLILIGFIINKTKLLDQNFDKPLGTFVLYVANPALIIHSVIEGGAEVDKLEGAKIILMSFIFYGAMILLAKLMRIVFRWNKDKIKAVQYEAMLVFTNMAFMGIPVAKAVYGDEGVFYIAILSIPFDVLIFSYGVGLLSCGDGKFNPKNLLNPSILAAVAAMIFFFTGIKFPDFLDDTIGMVGDVTVPLALFIIGFNLAKAPLKKIFLDYKIYPFVLIKMFLFPILMYLACRWIVPNKVFFGALVIVAAMPVGSMVTLLANEYGQDVERITKVTVITTILSLATIPMYIWVLNRF